MSFCPILAAPLLKPTDSHDDNTIYEAMKALRYPVLCSLKLDGIRAFRMPEGLKSRSMKWIPNKSIRERSLSLPRGFDMELFNPTLQYDEIQSIVMSEEHKDSNLIQFHLLDDSDNQMSYKVRVSNIVFVATEMGLPIPEVTECSDAINLMMMFRLYEMQHGEGICFRTPDSPYKQGRSTLKEQYLVKLCRNTTEEATIIGFEEQFCNTNTAKHNSVGKMDRSRHNSGMVGKGCLGAFLVKNEHGLEYRVGTGVGLTDDKRLSIWREQDKWLGKQVVIKSKGHGAKVKPRMPIYIGRREEGF